MATFIKLMNGAPRSAVSESYERQKLAEINREIEYEAAVKIQSWYRGLRNRHYLRFLNKNALLIQRCWRGFMGRRFCRIRVRNLVMIMRMNFYNAMAVRIQRRWRGYYVRKNTHNFYARKRYLEALAIKNQIVRSELEEFKEQLELEEKRRQQEKTEKSLQMAARKHHYLLSTYQSAGIYNSPFRDFPHEMEFRLRSAKPLSHKKKIKPTDATMGIVDSSSLPVKPHPPSGALPPIKEKRIQGPFKSQEEILMQRYKPLNPSLRVDTDYNSLDLERDKMKGKEWLQRLHVPFAPFSKRKLHYEPLLHTTSKYGHLPYGNKYFTEEKRDLHISDKRMQTVVSPIPIFEKFKDTYSKGSVILQ